MPIRNGCLSSIHCQVGLLSWSTVPANMALTSCSCNQGFITQPRSQNKCQLKQARTARTTTSGQQPDHRKQLGRLHAVPTADVADLQLVAEGLGVLGIAAGGLFGALWNLEKQNGARLQQELQNVQQHVTQLQQQLVEAHKQVQQEQKARKEAEEWKPRLDSAQEELFKLEKALELKDGQLAVFMNTAHRQIKGLEDTVKELQKM